MMQTRHLLSLATGLSALLAVPLPVLAAADAQAVPTLVELVKETSLSGSYLAAQIAAKDNDDEAAVAYYKRSLELDPTNTDLLRLYFLALTANGRIGDAVAVARSIPADDEQTAVVNLVYAVDALKRKDWKAAEAVLKQSASGDLDQMVEQLVVAWAAYGSGDTSRAISVATAIAGPDWVQVIRNYHSGLINAAAGNDRAAIPLLFAAIENQDAAAVLSETYMRAVEELIAAHTRLGEFDKANLVFANGRKLLASYPPFVSIGKALEAKQAIASHIDTAQKGASEVFYNVGTAISRQGGTPFAQGYLQLADHIEKGNDVVIMALAGVFETQKRHDRANAYYDQIPDSSAFFRRAELEHALNFNELKKVDEAKARLQKLIDSDPEDLLAYTTLGGVLSQHEEYGEAAAIYDLAASKIAKPEVQHWNLFYRRGIAHERIKQWDKAEANFRKALELSPDQADVLNYLGYSWIDKGINLEEGLAMIRKAVELSPRKGYIIDSLGWAYFKVGRFEEAVTELERAVDILPQDPVLNDHLGDAYWKAGRKLEATFQWNHALISKPEADVEARIRLKLVKGYVEEVTPTATAQ